MIETFVSKHCVGRVHNSTSSGVFSLNSKAEPPSSSDGYSGNLPVLSLKNNTEMNFSFDECMVKLGINMRKESANALPKVVGFLRVLQFPPTGNADRVGWD